MSAYADIDPSGLRVSAAEREPWVQFGDDARIVLPCHGSVGVSILGARALIHGWVQGQRDHAYLIWRTGEVTDFGPVAGTNGIALTALGAYIIRSEQKYTVGGHEHDVPTDRTGESIYGQGWTQIVPTGEPNWFDLQGIITLGGVRFVRWSRAEHWTVGLDGMPGAPNRSIAHDARTDRVFLIREGTFIAPHVAVYADGSCEVALSLPAEWVTSSKFQPYAASADEPISTISVPRLNRLFAFFPWFATSNDPSVLAIEPTGHRDHAGNLEIPINATQAQLARVKTPMVAPVNLFPLITDDALYAGLIHIDGETSDAHIQEAIPFYRHSAAARGRGLFVYDDRMGPGYRLSVIGPLLRPGDVAVPCWNPVIAAEIGPVLRTRLVTELYLLKSAGLIVAPSLCAYAMNGRLTRADLTRLWQLYFSIITDHADQLFGAGYFALLRADGVAGIAAFLATILAEFAAGLTGLPERPRPSTPIPFPTPSPSPKDPMATPKRIKIAARRDFEPQDGGHRFLGFPDVERHKVDASIKDIKDPRCHLEFNIFDHPNAPATTKPGQHNVGNWLQMRSAQDQVCISATEDLQGLRASHPWSGNFEIRSGEFPNTWRWVLPASGQALTVHTDGRVTLEPLGSVAESTHDFRLFDVTDLNNIKEIPGPF